ncbi:MAG: hypothetical protein LBG96_16345 [Tannerella sp.]|nr:hypothetical protein [Tannerella sp.]
MFKSDNGADAFCQLHSIVDTAGKNNQDPFLALIAVAHHVCRPTGQVNNYEKSYSAVNLELF